MNVLVTGNKGYIGSVLVPMLLQKGYSVRGFDVNYYRGCEFYKYDYKIKQIEKDIRKISKNDLENIDAVIHLAGLSNDPLCNFNPELTYAINYMATVRLAKIAKKCGTKRFIFASSQSMYGVSKLEAFEDSKLNPITTYGKSKIMSERELSKLADENFSPVYLRPSTVYGVSPMLRCDILLNNLVGWAFTSGKIFIHNRNLWRPAIHIEDISSAFIAGLEAPIDLIHNEAFNVGQNESNYAVGKLAEYVREFFPKCKIEYSKQEGKDPRTYKVNFDKINNKLKRFFKPNWDIKNGIIQLIEAFKKNGLTYEEFTGNKFIRLNQLKKLIKNKKINNKFYWINDKN